MTSPMLNLIASNNATLHAHYTKHGKPNDPGKRLNPPTRRSANAEKAHAFPDPFVAFDASVNGKTVYVSGYVRKDGRKVAGYWRRTRATRIGEVKPMYIGLVTDAGIEMAPLLVG